MTTKVKPEIVTEDHLDYLDTLREILYMPMLQTCLSPHIEDDFGVTKKEAREITSYWMATFEERQRGITETEINQMAVQSEMDAKSGDYDGND